MKKVLFRTLKPSGVLAISLVKGGIPYMLPNVNAVFKSKLYQVIFEAGHFTAIDADEEIIVANPLTSEGKKFKIVDLLRERIAEGGSGIEEVTEDDLKKDRMARLDSGELAKAYKEMIKNRSELNSLSKDKIGKYIDSLGVLGYDVENLLKLKVDAEVSKKDLVEAILLVTSPEDNATEFDKENKQD